MDRGHFPLRRSDADARVPDLAALERRPLRRGARPADLQLRLERLPPRPRGDRELRSRRVARVGVVLQSPAADLPRRGARDRRAVRGRAVVQLRRLRGVADHPRALRERPLAGGHGELQPASSAPSASSAHAGVPSDPAAPRRALHLPERVASVPVGFVRQVVVVPGRGLRRREMGPADHHLRSHAVDALPFDAAREWRPLRAPALGHV